jgi:hypothetical protein
MLHKITKISILGCDAIMVRLLCYTSNNSTAISSRNVEHRHVHMECYDTQL